ncbi:MAG: LysR family transcriptional regulator [Cyanobacteria bacterium P01_F01_bin.150]
MVSGSLQQPSIEFRHLQTFLTVVEEMSFSRAAERLGIAQPPLSRQIQRLEAKLDVKLFERTRPHIQLTSAGEVFADGARRILQQVNQSIQITQLVNQGVAGQLTVGVDSTSPGCDHAIQAIRTYRQEHPVVQVQVREMSVDAQLEALQGGEIDVGFMTPCPIPDSLFMDILIQEPLVAVLPSTHALAQQEMVSLSALKDEPLIMDTRRLEGENGIGNRLLQDELFHPKVVQSASDSRLILSFVASELGISILPASISKNSLRPEVVYRPIVPTIMMASLAVAWSSQNDHSVIAPFLEHLRQAQKS